MCSNIPNWSEIFGSSKCSEEFFSKNFIVKWFKCEYFRGLFILSTIFRRHSGCCSVHGQLPSFKNFYYKTDSFSSRELVCSTLLRLMKNFRLQRDRSECFFFKIFERRFKNADSLNQIRFRNRCCVQEHHLQLTCSLKS